jgi:hypothetical protein
VPLIFLVPLLLLAFLALVVVLVPVSLVLRYRGATARRQARGWIVSLSLFGTFLSASLFLLAATLTSFWVPGALRYSLGGMGIGIVAGTLGVAVSRWEAGPQSFHYTPNRWLVLAILLVVASRMGYSLWRLWHYWQRAPGDGSWLTAIGIPGSMGAGAIVIGYYLAYWAGLRWKVGRKRGLE